MKQSIPTLSLTDNVNVWLANSRQPNILHVFERACNLINERKEVLSIVTPQIGNGPFNLVLKDEICFFDFLNLESRVSLSPLHLMLGNLLIGTADAKLWNPRPYWEEFHAHRNKIINQITQLQITNYLSMGSLPITQSLVSLFLAFVNTDISSARSLAAQLAGFGVGLTPAGDDFLMGAMYAVWIIHPPEVASILVQEIANTAARLTTSLSAAWLRSAGKGEAGARWHEFFDALVSADLARIQETMKNILAVGETSGADALSGFMGVFVFASWREKADSSHG